MRLSSGTLGHRGPAFDDQMTSNYELNFRLCFCATTLTPYHIRMYVILHLEIRRPAPCKNTNRLPEKKTVG